MSEDVPVSGEVLVAEGIRVPEDIRVPEGIRVPEHLRVRPLSGTRNFRVLDRKKLKLPDLTRPEKMFYPDIPSYILLKSGSHSYYNSSSS